VTDASCGLELVSPILVGRDGLKQIETVCKVLGELGINVNRSCGLHVHHDAREFDLRTWKNLSMLYAKYEDQLDKVMPLSRRVSHNTYCQSVVAGRDIAQMFKAIKEARDLREVELAVTGGQRFSKINYQSYVRHGSVEIRHHSGTVEAAKIINWVKLTFNMIREANRVGGVNLRGAGSFGSLMQFAAGKAGKDFYTARATAFGTL
jgi:hypothetical protein